MSGRFVRASLYRHVHGDPVKVEGEFSEMKPQCTGEGNYIAANDKFFCYATAGGGGPVVVHPLNKPGRLAHNVPTVQVHRDAVLDFEFHPFHSNLLATGSEDCHIKLTQIPDGGLTSNITTALADLEGHERKVNILHFHPTASNVIASASADLTLKVWDVEKQSNMLTYSDFGDVCQSFDWSPDGSMMVTTSKDLHIRMFDPRQASSVVKTAGFTGPKSSRALFAGNKGKILAVGASKGSQRQYGVWDIKNMSKPLSMVDIDQSAGVLMPYYDADNSILYLAGKGDGNIRYFEVVDEEPYIHYLSEFRDSNSQKGVTWLPKRSCDTTKCEIAVCLRLMKDKMTPISFQVPRKADTFQKDIFPDCYAGVAAQSAGEYFAGQNKPAPRRSMKPGDSSAVQAQQTVTLKVQKSPAELQRELDAANARIAQLEAELAKLRH